MQSQAGQVPGVILASGAGRRIGGDKAQVMLAGRPLWRHVADRVAPQVSVLAINGPGVWGDYGHVRDEVPGLGPLGGVLAAMRWGAGQGAERVLTVAVDTPFLPGDLVARLADTDGPVAIARTGDGLHGTTALWDVALAGDLHAALARGTRKVTDWAGHHGIAPVDFPDTTPPAFFNVNTAQDLARAEAWLA
ncbi:molybdenum cofactor guanylyltransferase [Hasllibacter sp. MH4015]|uniref:molybdenum cofactor guanylyltransferase n=1 Tax=Hasllibacter sp. MH4015 TaxID=2854029 RepID=UPI001CD342ED|nr:molybdenum cofactor guanylyltransferase [Hasllibacter sp. MH4015]